MNKLSHPRCLQLVISTIVTIMLVTACGGSDEPTPIPEEATKETTVSNLAEKKVGQFDLVDIAATAPAEEEGEKISIILAENPWPGSQVNVAVAKILLEEKMDFPVEIIAIDENAQWSALATGDLHASLEVWPSRHADNVAQYIDDQQVVENAGLLGPAGEDELFKVVASSLKDDAPEAYEFLKNFHYSTEDQSALIAAVEADGKSVEEAAQAWIDENETIWQDWLP